MHLEIGNEASNHLSFLSKTLENNIWTPSLFLNQKPATFKLSFECSIPDQLFLSVLDLLYEFQ
jgi:hypothetical protein